MDDLYSQSFIKVKNITISNLESFHKDVRKKINILFIKYPFFNSIQQQNIPVHFVNNKIQADNYTISQYKSYVLKMIYEKLSSSHFSAVDRDQIMRNIKIEYSICTESNFISSI